MLKCFARPYSSLIRATVASLMINRDRVDGQRTFAVPIYTVFMIQLTRDILEEDVTPLNAFDNKVCLKTSIKMHFSKI